MFLALFILFNSVWEVLLTLFLVRYQGSWKSPRLLVPRLLAFLQILLFAGIVYSSYLDFTLLASMSVFYLLALVLGVLKGEHYKMLLDGLLERYFNRDTDQEPRVLKLTRTLFVAAVFIDLLFTLIQLSIAIQTVAAYVRSV